MKLLAERLKRQHRLICAAIHSGRINDLKKMGGRGKQAPKRAPAQAPAPAAEASEPVEPEEVAVEVETAVPVAAEEAFEIEYWPMTQEWTPPPPPSEEETVEEAELLAADETGELVDVEERRPKTWIKKPSPMVSPSRCSTTTNSSIQARTTRCEFTSVAGPAGKRPRRQTLPCRSRSWARRSGL